MMQLSKKIMILLCGVLVFSVSCTDLNDENANSSRYVTWGFMSVTGGDYYIKTDTKKMLKLQEFDNSSLKLKQGDRVYAAFFIVDNKNSKELTANATYTNLVRISNIYKVDYDAITKITDENRDLIKNGYVNVRGIGITANNLNLEVQHNYLDEKPHKIMLCYDEANQVDDNGTVQLDLKDSSDNNNFPNRLVTKLQSFDISKLVEWGTKDSKGNINFIVTVNKKSTHKKEFKLVYKP